MTVWLVVRVVMVAANFLRHLFPAAATPPADSLAEFPPVVMLVFGAVAIPFIMVARLRGKTPWSYPGWRQNPFALKQPLQLFHFAAWFFMANGAGGLLRAAIDGRPATPESLVWGAFGAGVLVGVHVSARLYRKKMVPRTGAGVVSDA